MINKYFDSREELEEKLNYTNMPIYVRKLSATDKCDDPDFPGFEPGEQLTDLSSSTDRVEEFESNSRYAYYSKKFLINFKKKSVVRLIKFFLKSSFQSQTIKKFSP